MCILEGRIHRRFLPALRRVRAAKQPSTRTFLSMNEMGCWVKGRHRRKIACVEQRTCLKDVDCDGSRLAPYSEIRESRRFDASFYCSHYWDWFSIVAVFVETCWKILIQMVYNIPFKWRCIKGEVAVNSAE